MKKSVGIVSLIMSIVIFYMGYSYYNNDRKKESYKKVLIKDLEQAYRRISLEELEKAKRMNKNIQNYFDTIKQDLRISKKLEIKYLLIKEKNINSNLDLETLEDSNWKAAQQSGVLNHFNKDELVVLNKVYSLNETLRVVKEAVNNLTLESFSSSTKDEISTISYKYLVVLLKLEAALYNLENATKNAIVALDPDNKLIKELNLKR